MYHGFRVIILVLLLCGVAGCRNGPGASIAVAGLQKTAAEYYNFRVGNNAGREYSDFLSPAYRSSFSKEDLALLNRGNAPSIAKNTRIEEVRAEDVVVSTEAGFAMTDVPPRLGFAFESMDALLWVRSGSRWFLYLGSDKEISEYGYFPVGIPFPKIPEELPAQVEEGKRRPAPEPAPDGA